MRKTIITTLLLSSLATPSVFANDINMKDAALQYGNTVISDQLQKAKENGNDFWKRTDISIQIQSGLKPQYSIETIQPLSETERTTNFYQFRIGNDLGSGTTANLGFGQRVLSADKKTMVGYNAFYDHAFKYGHQRVGLGGEYFFGRNEFRVNTYRGISDPKLIDATTHMWERVLNGYDYELGTALPNAPWMKVFVQGFQWDYKYAEDAKGYKLRSEVQVTPRFSVEFGYVHDNKGTSDPYGKIMYTIGNKVPAMFEDGKKVFRNDDHVTVEGKKLQKVKRDNNIEVERYIEDTNNPSAPMLTVGMSSIRG